jgi:cell division protein ZapE
MLQSPLSAYRLKIQAKELRPDPSQSFAVEKLQSLHVALGHSERESGLKSWKGCFGLRRRSETPPQGLYMFGGVGRGKSMLMDLFFHTAPVKNKYRVHFHAFMQQVHYLLNEHRKWNGRSDDPIPPIGKSFAKKANLLCFDDFQVHDIADAMILSRLFEVLFDEGVVVVLTSNRPPSDLYKDGLQRALFLPFIALIEEKLDQLILDGPTDYRRETIKHIGMYLTPNDKDAEVALKLLFERLTSDAQEPPDPIIVNGRELNLPSAADGVALSGFEELCGATLGPADYLAIADHYHTLIICGIPQLGPESRNEAKRFVTLIDALYENGVKLICSADVAPSELYVEGDGAFEFERTVSRLIEMQSEDYLCKGHAA